MASSPKQQELEIVRILAQDGPHTAAQLAKRLNVSVRTLRSRVKRINGAVSSGGLIIPTRHGYEIDMAGAQLFLASAEETKVKIPQTNEDRATWVLQQLVRSDEPIGTYDMAEKLYISTSTMNLVMAKVRHRLADNDLGIRNEGGGVAIKGTERNRRRLMSELLFDEGAAGYSEFVGIDTIQDFFPEIDVAAVDSIVKSALDDHHRFANEYYITNLVVHVVIAIDRSSSANPSNPNDSGCHPSEDTLAIASEIAQQLNQTCHYQLGAREVDELSILLSSSTKPMNAPTSSIDGLRSYIDKDTFKLVDKLISDLRSHYDVDLSDDEFYVRFALHINGLMKRAAEGHYVHNPLSSDIKARCPLLYDAAVCEAEVIRRETGFTINDDEIAYIAFHLGSTFDAQRQLSAKVRAILCCPSWYGVGSRILSFLSCYFGETLVVTSVVESIHPELEQREDNADLIISVSKIGKTWDIPVYYVGISPGPKDVEALQILVSRILHKRSAEHLYAATNTLLSPDAFLFRPDVETREDAIQIMASQLHNLGLVPQDYEKQVLAREALSDTAFGIVAIPHTMGHCALRSTICVLIPKRPIDWGSTRVELVLMLAFNQLERSAFNEVFDSLVSILQSSEKVRKLAESTTFPEFRDALGHMLEEEG